MYNPIMKIGETYDTDHNLRVQELIRIAIQSKSYSTRNVTTKKEILKTLFLVRERLSDTNPVKYILAFYWYRDGPYSEIIEDNLRILVDDQKISKSETDKWETYRLAPKYTSIPILQYDNFMEEAAGKIRDVASESANIHDMVRQIYETAPTPWYTSYKLEFMPKFETYCKDIKRRQECVHTPKQILEFLDDAVLDFPTAPGFLEIRMIFMDFAKILNAFLRWDAHHTRSDLLDELSIICNNIWETFADGVRVYHHDPYYEHHVDRWKHEYEHELYNLDRIILEYGKKFDSIVVDDMHLAPDMEDMVLHPERHTFKQL